MGEDKDIRWLGMKCSGFSVNRKGVSRVAVDVPVIAGPVTFCDFIAPKAANLVGTTIWIPGHYDVEENRFRPLDGIMTDISPVHFASLVRVEADAVVDEAEARRLADLGEEFAFVMTRGEIADIISDERDIPEDSVTREQVVDYAVAMRDGMGSGWMRENCMMDVRSDCLKPKD